MSKIKTQQIKKIKKIVKDYINLLEENDFNISQAYIYGSFARGDFHENSDIDVAVISDKFARNWDKNENLLWKMRRQIDLRIEPIGYEPKDFNISDPLVAQIKKKNIKVK